MHNQSVTPEFSRIMETDRLGEAESVYAISALLEERRALAARFDLLALDELSAHIALGRVPGGGAIRLTGRILAVVTQRCVVTLEPVVTRIEEEFTQLYTSTEPAGAEIIIELDDDNESSAEPIPAGVLDIGEAVAQQLALLLPEYPRARGVELDPKWTARTADATAREGPFATLSALKKRLPGAES